MFNILKITLVTAFLLSATFTFAQERPLIVETKINPNKSVDFNYTKTDPATYTVIVTFSSLQNTTGSYRQVATATASSGRLFSLTPSNPAVSVTYSYRYSYIRGRVLRKYEKDIQYLLPYKEGVKMKVMEAGYMPAMYFGSEKPVDWKAYNFYSAKEDTVVASRKGVVVQVKDLYETDNPGDQAFKSTMNEVIIEHPDGTFARYRGLKKGIFVRLGQTVIPGTAIGMNTLFQASSRQYNIALHFYYLASDDVESLRDRTLKTSKSLYSSITPLFYTKEGANIMLENRTDYTAASSPDLIKQELSKKELKNMAKN